MPFVNPQQRKACYALNDPTRWDCKEWDNWRCKEHTSSGRRCQRKATHKGYCSQHYKILHGKGLMDKLKQGYNKVIRRVAINPFGAVKETYQDVKYRYKSLTDKDYRTNVNKSFEEFLNNNNKEISSVQVGRKPIKKGYETVMNILSGGQFGKTKDRLDYDEIYHQYLIVNYKDGTSKLIQKNHLVQERDVNDKDRQNVFVNIPVNKPITTKDLIDNAKEEDKNLFDYSARDANCQDFVKAVVDGNQLLPEIDTKQVLQTQDAKQLVNSLPESLRGVPYVITELANIGDRVIRGNGGGVKNDILRARLIIDGIL